MKRMTWVDRGRVLVPWIAGFALTACGGGSITTEATPGGDGGAAPVGTSAPLTDGQTAEALDAAIVALVEEAGVLIFFQDRSTVPPYPLAPPSPANPELVGLANRISHEQRGIELELLSTMERKAIEWADSPLSKEIDREAIADFNAIYRSRGAERDSAYIKSTLRGLSEMKGIVDENAPRVQDEALRTVVARTGSLVAQELSAAYEAQRRTGPLQ